MISADARPATKKKGKFPQPGEFYRKGAGRDRGVELDGKETKVDGKGGIDGELDPRGDANVLLDGEALLVVRAEELVNELVLLGVKGLELLLVAPRVVNLHLPPRDIFTSVPPKVERVCTVYIVCVYTCSG